MGFDLLQNSPTYIFSGGGTGGHLFPGIAVAQELLRRDSDVKVLFVGSDRQVEKRIVNSHGLEHLAVRVESLSALKRRPLRFAWNNCKAWRIGRRIVVREQPAVVVGLGGFASAPVVLAATHSGVPSILLEQNVVPGKATRWLMRHVSKCCVSFAQTSDHLQAASVNQTANTGNPIRPSIAALCERVLPADPDAPQTLLVLGGSQGATALNDAMLRVVENMPALPNNWKIVHQTGCHGLEQIRKKYSQLGIDAHTAAFFDDLPDVYRRASLAVSRAGATTLAELACAGIPAVVVPYPNATDNHQFFNASIYADRGGALIVDQCADPGATAQSIHDQLSLLLSDRPRLNRMELAMRSLARPDAAQAVADEIMLLSV